MYRTIRLTAVVVSLSVWASSVFAQTPADTIRNLYESAAYEEALAALDRLAAARPPRSGGEPTELRVYRGLCLLALERNDDAEKAIADLLTVNPKYRPEPQASPQWTAELSRVQSKIAPEIVRRHYASGKRHFDNREFADAASDFEIALDFLNDSVLDRKVVESLSDVAMLSRAFLQLSRPSPGLVVARQPRIPGPPVSPVPPRIEDARAQAATPVPAESRGWMARFTRYRVYSSNDPGVVPPVTVDQALPFWDASEPGEFDGELEVVVSEEGNVEAAILRKPVHPDYDRALVMAAQRWRYQPAHKDGATVKFRATLKVHVGPANSGD